jgi:WD40 repeat protein
LQGTIRNTLTGHSEVVRSVSVRLDGKCTATVGYDLTILIWNTETGREARTVPVRNSGSFSHGMHLTVEPGPDGRRLASGDSAADVPIWDPFRERGLVYPQMPKSADIE